MCPADKEVFSSFAHAQVSLTNEIYQYLGEPETFLFCPTGTPSFFAILYNSQCLYYHLFNYFLLCWNTEYCGTFCYPSVSQSPYLRTVGEKLLPSIDVLWTGECKSVLAYEHHSISSAKSHWYYSCWIKLTILMSCTICRSQSGF